MDSSIYKDTYLTGDRHPYVHIAFNLIALFLVCMSLMAPNSKC